MHLTALVGTALGLFGLQKAGEHFRAQEKEGSPVALLELPLAVTRADVIKMAQSGAFDAALERGLYIKHGRRFSEEEISELLVRAFRPLTRGACGG